MGNGNRRLQGSSLLFRLEENKTGYGEQDCRQR